MPRIPRAAIARNHEDGNRPHSATEAGALAMQGEKPITTPTAIGKTYGWKPP